MKNATGAFLSLSFLVWLAGAAHAGQMAASCSRLLGVSDGEAGYIYFRAEEDLGRATADRLWGAYHRLKSRCAGHPDAQVVVNVEPRVRAFLEAYR